MPFRITLVGWKGEHFQGMPVRIAEIESANSTGVPVPIGQPLRTWRSVLHFVLAQPLISLVHIADNQRYMLEPAIVAARVDGRGTPFWRQVLRQLDELVAQAQARAAQLQSEDALQVFERI